MSSLRCSVVIILALSMVGCGRPHQVETKKVPKEFIEFGHTRVDDYYWLNNPKDSAVIPHLQAENAYTEAMLKHTESLQKRLYDEMVSRVEQKYESLPSKQNGYWYYTRFEEGKQYPLYCRKKGEMSAAEEVFLDVPALAAGKQIYMVRGYAVSPANRWLAYGVDTTGDRRCVLHVRDLLNGSALPEVVPNTSGQYAWGKDEKTLFYVLNDPTVRAYKLMRHVLGADVAKDKEVFTERDSTFGLSLSTSRDMEYILIGSGSTLSSEHAYIRASVPASPPVLIQPRQKDVLYSVEDNVGATLYLLTNKDARNFRLVQAPLNSPGMKSWRDVIPHRTDALLQGAMIFTKYIVAQQKIGGLNQILVIDRATGKSEYLSFAEQVYVVNMSSATDAVDLDSIRYSYTSLTTPRSDYLYSLATKERVLLKQEKVGGGYDPTLYETRRIWATATDSVRVPISIVFRKSLLKNDGSNPALLYAYGSYGASTDPYFNPAVISLLDRGFVYAIGHIRGGQEMGRQWYEDGKVLKKRNTFTDFVACAQYLVDEKYTASERLFANGGSAGGMLMGAVTNMRPDLFRGILADVPWMDVITDSENPDLPLTTLEYDEWGDPGIKEVFEYLLTWSPYDNVNDARYPAIFATAGLHDTQVPYFSPAKWVAKVREHNRGSNPVLLKVNMGAGHSGESGRFERFKLTAMKYAFIADLAGIKE
jgi:oligopeptidase B